MVLTVSLCLAVLALGVATAVKAAGNRARAAELDATQRECEHLGLEIERVRFDLRQRERELLERLLARSAEAPREVTQ